MSQLKFYKGAVIALIVLNLSLISFFFFTKPKGGPPQRNSPHNFQEEIRKTLNLNDAQVIDFERLAKEHSTMMEAINVEKSSLLKSYFDHLKNESTSTTKEDLLTMIEKLEGDKIKYTYKHFEDLKTSLNEDQSDKFEEILEKLINKLVISKRKNPPHHKR